MTIKHRILLISTGGTIAGEVAENKIDPMYEIKTAKHFSDLIKDTVINIKIENNIELEIDPREYKNIDSTDIKPENWIELVNIIKEEYDKYDSFIITHGTNTLGYTCAALSFALLNNGKCVVLTGSQVPIGLPASDAKTNLDNAIRMACWQKHDVFGVVAVFGSHIISGTRVKKSTEFDYDAFQSFNTGSIGRIGRIIDINEDNLTKHNSFYINTKGAHTPRAKNSAQLKIDNRFNANIVSLTEFPGMDPNIFNTLVTNLGTKGFILRAFGAGDVAHSLSKALKFLKKEKIPIVISTQAPMGNANLQVNEPGQYIRDNELGIPAYDMGIEAQTTKLSWLLAKMEDGDITYEELCVQMNLNIRGEIKVMWEDVFGM